MKGRSLLFRASAKWCVLATLADNPGFGMALVDMLAHEVHHLREVWQNEYNRTASAAPD